MLGDPAIAAAELKTLTNCFTKRAGHSVKRERRG